MKMIKMKPLFLICAIAVFIVSCRKEVNLQDLTNPPPGGGSGSGNNNSIIGKWNFVGMTAHSKTTITAGTGIDEEKIISSYGFISQQNKGTITIDASKFTSAGIGYSIDTVVNTEMYLGGVLFDTLETDFQIDMPLSSGSVAYQAIGTDSIYFESGFITLEPSGGAGTPTATTPAGYKISWLSDTLVLKMQQSKASIQNVNGVQAQVVNNISQMVKLKK